MTSITTSRRVGLPPVEGYAQDRDQSAAVRCRREMTNEVHPTHWFILTLAKTVLGVRLAAADLSEELHEVRQAVARAAGDLCGNEMRRVDSRAAAMSVQIHFHAESVPRGGGPRPLPPGPRGGGPRLCRNQLVCTKSRRRVDSADFYAVLCGGAPRGGGPRGGGPLGGGPRGGGPRGGPPMVFYARGCPLVPSGCIRSENGPRPATLLQRDRTKSFRQQQRRGAAYAPKNLAASGPLLLQVGALAAA